MNVQSKIKAEMSEFKIILALIFIEDGLSIYVLIIVYIVFVSFQRFSLSNYVNSLSLPWSLQGMLRTWILLVLDYNNVLSGLY